MLLGTCVWRGNVKQVKSSEVFDFLEIDLETLDPRELTLQRCFSFHAPHTPKFSHPSLEIENSMIELLRRACERARSMGAEYITYHFSFPLYGVEEIDSALMERAKENAKRVTRGWNRAVFETLVEKRFSSPELFSYLTSIGCNICMDTGHFSLSAIMNGKDPYRELEKFLERFRGRVLVAHVHNISPGRMGKFVAHVLNGILDLWKVLEIIESFSIRYTVLEIFSIDATRSVYAFDAIEEFAEKIRKKF